MYIRCRRAVSDIRDARALTLRVQSHFLGHAMQSGSVRPGQLSIIVHEKIVCQIVGFDEIFGEE